MTALVLDGLRELAADCAIPLATFGAGLLSLGTTIAPLVGRRLPCTPDVARVIALKPQTDVAALGLKRFTTPEAVAVA